MSLFHGVDFVFDPPCVAGTASLCVASMISMGFSVPVISKAAVLASLALPDEIAY
jgi:hypothetical protein